MLSKKEKERIAGAFDANEYQMKEKYQADYLMIANLERVSMDSSTFEPVTKTTNQKYFFEFTEEGNYREIFTGFITNDQEEYFNLPYAVNIVPFTKIFPDMLGKEIPRFSFLWLQNEINKNLEEKQEPYQKKKKI